MENNYLEELDTPVENPDYIAKPPMSNEKKMLTVLVAAFVVSVLSLLGVAQLYGNQRMDTQDLKNKMSEVEKENIAINALLKQNLLFAFDDGKGASGTIGLYQAIASTNNSQLFGDQQAHPQGLLGEVKAICGK